ncbi:MAG: hypothetical protein PSV13_11650 [Lacunisphaera sp.]|nr:hypothetical protein [Lacunisphaera sp.]
MAAPSRLLPAPRVGSSLRMLCGIASILAATGPTLAAAEPTPLYRWTTFAGRATTEAKKGSGCGYGCPSNPGNHDRPYSSANSGGQTEDVRS